MVDLKRSSAGSRSFGPPDDFHRRVRFLANDQFAASNPDWNDSFLLATGPFLGYTVFNTGLYLC